MVGVNQMQKIGQGGAYVVVVLNLKLFLVFSFDTHLHFGLS